MTMLTVLGEPQAYCQASLLGPGQGEVYWPGETLVLARGDYFRDFLYFLCLQKYFECVENIEGCF